MRDNGLATLKAENSIAFKTLDNGKTEISFIVDKLTVREKNELRAKLESVGDTLTVRLSKYHEKRSCNANAYFWTLCGELADVLNKSKNEIYQEYIRNFGIYKTVEVDEKAVDTIIHVWSQYGTGWIAEKLDKGNRDGFMLVNLYYGSSCYNTRQMSRLIDNIVIDCKEQGIETLKPDELDEIKRMWSNAGKP